MSVQEKALHIDIPVKLAEVKNVFSIASLSFEGDLPASIFHLQLIVNDISDWKAKSDAIVVFHTNAGHPTLHDQAYNADRNIATGNPYKKLITDLMERGVRVELCGATAKAHGWGNADVIPGIKINTDAMSRLTQLVQQGFCKDLGILGMQLRRHYTLPSIEDSMSSIEPMTYTKAKSTPQRPIGPGFGPETTAVEVIRGVDLSGKTEFVTGRELKKKQEDSANRVRRLSASSNWRLAEHSCCLIRPSGYWQPA